MAGFAAAHGIGEHSFVYFWRREGRLARGPIHSDALIANWRSKEQARSDGVKDLHRAREGASALTVPCARERGTPSLNFNVLFLAVVRGVLPLRQEILKLCGLSAVWTRVAFVDNLNYPKLC